MRRMPLNEMIHAINVGQGGYLQQNSNENLFKSKHLNYLMNRIDHSARKNEQDLDKLITKSPSTLAMPGEGISPNLISRIKNLTKVFLFVILGKLDPRKKKQFRLLKMTEMLTITNKYKSFEIIVSQMVESMNNRFGKDLKSMYINVKTEDLVDFRDISAIASRISYTLINSMAICTDNYLFLTRKYLKQLNEQGNVSKFDAMRSELESFKF